MRVALLLYSTNPWLKFAIQKEFRANLHYVWCSEVFDARKADKYSISSAVPASSSPAGLYEELRRDITQKDRHSAKITSQRTSYKARAVEWFEAGEISAEQRDEITCLADSAELEYWRPLIYVIPRAGIDATRIQRVAPQARAGIGAEYIIKDLAASEFEVIDLW